MPASTRNIDISLLRAFAAVVDRRSMTGAAADLSLSQGAVSQQIARLEALCGDALLVRSREGMAATPYGERLLAKTRQLLTLNDELWADINGGALSGVVRLGAPHDLINAYLAPLLKTYAQACPQVEIALTCASSVDLKKRVADNELDLAIVEEPLGASAGECLAIERLVWAGVRHGQASRKAPLPIAMASPTCVFRPAVFAALREQGRDWRMMADNGGLDGTMAMARSDLAVTVWLAVTVPADLTILPPESGLPALPSYAISLYQSDAPSMPAAAAELARHIRARQLQAGQLARAA